MSIAGVAKEMSKARLEIDTESAFNQDSVLQENEDDDPALDEAQIAALEEAERINRERLTMEVEDVNMTNFPARTLADYPVSL